MQDDFSTSTESGRQGLKTKKNGNGKWISRQEAEMDNEAATPSTLAPHTSSTPTLAEDTVANAGQKDLMSTAREAYEGVVTRGSDLLKKVDLSRGTGLIREYPIQAAVGGMIVGFLLGAAVFRRQE